MPLIWEFGRQWSGRAPHTEARCLGGAAGPWRLGALGIVAFPLYVRFGLGADSLLAPFAVHSQRFAGRFALPGQSIVQAIRVLASGTFRLIEPFDLAFALLFVALTLLAFWRLPTTYAVYMAVMLAGATAQDRGRAAPALRLALPADALSRLYPPGPTSGARSPWWNRAILYPSAALLIFFTGQFVLWGWVG